MTIPLFDVQTGFGGARPGQQVLPLEELLGEMDRLAIGRALVRTAPADLDADFVWSNETLLAATETGERLVPCPVVVPSAGDDLPPEPEHIGALIEHGARAVTIRPGPDCWSLAPWCCGQLMSVLQERRLPVFCQESLVSLEQVAELADRYPDLPLIVAGVVYRSMRKIAPLVMRFDNVYLSTGTNFTVHMGIERLIDLVGPERLLFGTGFPDVEPAMAVGQLMYADLGDDDRRLIGAGNLERLIAEVRS
ncbi:MAG: amidohydrolase family protein [Planctomycetes bacterium]|nr:amidohydrolase family protein [Planctomycetota bacterium]